MTISLFDLSGRTALVTGSSRGLGRAFAQEMTKAGARLIVNGTDLEAPSASIRNSSWR